MMVNKQGVVIDFPLRGEWYTPTTPAKKIPSHGTNRMGLRYAFDFLQINWEKPGKTFYASHPFKYLLIGVPLKECYGWGKGIYAPCDGEILTVSDGLSLRKKKGSLAPRWLDCY